MRFHLLEGSAQLQQACAAKSQGMFFRLVLGANRIIQIGRAGLLDVVAEDVRYRLVARELDETLDAGHVQRKIGDIQTAWIESIPCQQDACREIIEGDADSFMTGKRDNVPEKAFQVAGPD